MTEDKLEAIFRMQKVFADQIQANGRFPHIRDQQVDELCKAIIQEAAELQRLTSWKWWKIPTQMNLPESREELIDIFHFVIHCALVLDMTADDFLKEYEKKMEINKQRQREGY